MTRLCRQLYTVKCKEKNQITCKTLELKPYCTKYTVMDCRAIVVRWMDS